MLYMKGTSKMIVLEPGNIEQLLAGKALRTPDGSIRIFWTPDPVWLADKIMGSSGDVEEIVRLINESAKRPQKPIDRPFHATHVHDFTKPKDEL